jgi:alpha-N-arabinofuranosidase
VVNYRPLAEGDRAGILALQNDDFYLFYGLAMRDGKTVLEITRRAGPNDPRDGVVITTLAAPSGPVSLHAEITGGTARFTYGPDAKSATVAAENIDATNLSTAKAGGFVGTIIGLYAASGKTP